MLKELHSRVKTPNKQTKTNKYFVYLIISSLNLLLVFVLDCVFSLPELIDLVSYSDRLLSCLSVRPSVRLSVCQPFAFPFLL